MTVERRRELNDQNLFDCSLRLFFMVCKKLNCNVLKESTIRHVELITGVKERELKIMLTRYKDFNAVKMTLKECGNEFGVCQERIRQIICKVMRKIRYHSRIASMEDFLKGEKI